MTTSTFTKAELATQLEQLEAQLAAAKEQQSPSLGELNIVVELPEETELINGYPAIKEYVYENVPYVNAKCAFMIGDAYGRQYSLTFGDHLAKEFWDRLHVGERRVQVTCKFRTRIWQKSPSENVTLDSWMVESISNLPGRSFTPPTPEQLELESNEEMADATSGEEIPF